MLAPATRFLKALALPESARILVGFSGGADSCALLHFLVDFFGSHRLLALHVNHGIRGEEALRDESFAAEFAAELGVSFLCRRADVPALITSTGDSPEDAARKVRYQAFEEVALSHGCTHVALAHHGNDFAETFFLNLARGSGSRGLSSIPAIRSLGNVTVIRPFLGIDREDIETYCSQHGLSFVTDSTNLSDDYPRNKLRHHVLPVLREINPAFTKKLREAADALSEDDAYLTSLAQKEYASRLTGETLLAAQLFALPTPISTRVLKLYLEDLGLPFNRAIFASVKSLFDPGHSPSGTVTLPGGIQLCRSYDHLSLESAELSPLSPVEIDLEVNGTYPLTEELTLVVTHCPFPGAMFCSPSTIYIRPQAARALVRPRQSGDEWVGPNGKKSLKRLFIDRKIPKSERERIPVVEIGGRVICVYLLGPSFPERVDGVGQPAICLDFVKTTEDHQNGA
ncbi:MAG: tRNA lysidine(34) synthetase TilS [Clostridia bacterium]|nr:tRNA lysidine(34) synthetase TilS [Clostridia bacterium]